MWCALCIDETNQNPDSLTFDEIRSSFNTFTASVFIKPTQFGTRYLIPGVQYVKWKLELMKVEHFLNRSLIHDCYLCLHSLFADQCSGRKCPDSRAIITAS